VPLVASGQALVVAMLALAVGDVIGGFLGVASGAETWRSAWGFDTESTVPLPVAVVQLVLAWLAARDVRPRSGRVAALVLSAFCLSSLVFGSFDGDLIDNVRSEGWVSTQVLWALVLLLVTAVVGLLAAARARQLRPPR
jgi:hypothetical protein